MGLLSRIHVTGVMRKKNKSDTYHDSKKLRILLT